MGRTVILGNGSLTVGLDEKGLVHDFYFPYVGQDNLTTARSAHHKIGVWVDGVFSWVDGDNWKAEVDFESEALVSNVKLINESLSIEIFLEDFVDSSLDVFFRRITVKNTAGQTREVRLFMHQVFQISRNGRADAALFVPDENYILDYKGHCTLLISGLDHTGKNFDQFAVGNYGIEGKEGTFRDAEDGELSGSAVEHGGVDSVIRFSANVDSGRVSAFDYWVIAADSQFRGEAINQQIKNEGVEKRLASTRHFWRTWLSVGQEKLAKIQPKYRTFAKKSLLTIKSHIDKHGGIIASCDSSIYNYGRDYYSYVWPRDGAYAIWPLIRLGYSKEPKKFFEFCKEILTPDGYLMHKYQPDKSIGSTWHPLLHGNHKELAIQEDETAIVLYMLGEYYEYSKDDDFIASMYDELIYPMAEFLCKFIDPETMLPHASYDLWEQRFGTHTYTAAVVYQALLVAADFANMKGRADDGDKWTQTTHKMLDNRDAFYDFDKKIYRKSFSLKQDHSLEFDNTLDLSSLYGVIMFGYHDNDLDKIKSTQEAIEQRLLDQSPSGGSPRYEYDEYFSSDPAFKGNPWIVTTLWMAQFYYRTKDVGKAKSYVDWAMKYSLPSGVLSEQVNPTSGQPVSVTPLVWSHAEVINTLLDIFS